VSEPHSESDPDLARVLALLDAASGSGVTLEALREAGIRSPGQSVYALQVAGYAIDRVSCVDSDGHKALGYCLRAVPLTIPEYP
jgi:hypothetical protein